MPHDMPIEIASLVQTAIAPIFMLVAVSNLLGVMTHRLGRVVDRARQLEVDLDSGLTGEARAREVRELHTLSRRITYVNRAITLCAICAVSICVVVALLFLGALFEWAVRLPVALIFIVTMAALIAGLGHFLAEVFVANRALRVRAELLRS